MLSVVVRLRSPWLRVPLVSLLFPLEFVKNFLRTLARSPSRVLQASYYDLPFALYCAALDGTFVKGPR